MKVTIFGSGYVGLVTAACLADAGNKVVCVDIDPRKVDMLRRGGGRRTRAISADRGRYAARRGRIGGLAPCTHRRADDRGIDD